MSAPVDFTPRLLSVKDATRFTGLCKSTLYQLVRDGTLRPTKYGTKTLFAYDELRAFADSILARRDADTHAPARSAEAKRRRSHRKPNIPQQQQTHW
jgi:excisionase family DNA binding protein